MDPLEQFRSKKRLQFEDYDPSLGETNTAFVSVDLAVQYLLHVICEKNKEGTRYAMTEGIFLSNNKDLTVRKTCDRIAKKYKELLDNYKDLDGIYTVVNASPYLGATAHQNWLLFDVKNDVIIRMEPNGEGFDKPIINKDYRFYDLLTCISESLKVRWVYATRFGINNFNGCRATSTILALLSLMEIDYSEIERARGSYLALALAVSESIKGKACRRQGSGGLPGGGGLPSLPWTGGRSQVGLKTFIVPYSGIELYECDVYNFNDMNEKDIKAYLKKHDVPFNKNWKKARLVKAAIARQNIIYIS